MPLREPATIALGMVSAYLTPAVDGCALVDAGMPGQEGKVFAAMAALGVAPESLRLIVVTHAHADHIGSLQAIAQRSHAPVLVHRSEAPTLAGGAALSPRGLTTMGRVMAALMGPFTKRAGGPPCPADVLVDDELSLADFGVRGRVLRTPGHTSGSLTLLLDDGSAFVGDLCANLPLTGGRSHLPYFGDDRDTVYASWRLLLDAGATRIYPGHGAPFAASALRDELARAARSTTSHPIA